MKDLLQLFLGESDSSIGRVLNLICNYHKVKGSIPANSIITHLTYRLCLNCDSLGVGWVWCQVGLASGGFGVGWVWRQVGLASGGFGISWVGILRILKQKSVTEDRHTREQYLY